MKVIIAGSRDFNDSQLLTKEMDLLLANTQKVTIVSGLAKGADTLGIEYAKRRQLELIEMPADWKKHGRAAGIIRNKQMGDLADALAAFWDGKSKGTKHMIDYMLKLEKPVRIVPVNRQGDNHDLEKI